MGPSSGRSRTRAHAAHRGANVTAMSASVTDRRRCARFILRVRRAEALASAATSLRRFELMPLCVAPETLERIEGAALAAEDVHDEVEVVEQNPFRLVGAFGERRPLREFLLQRLANRIGNRRDLPRVVACTDHEVIGEAAGL